VNAEDVQAGLLAAGAPFGTPAARMPALRWGPLLADLDGGSEDEYVRAVELIYEGYLFHYRRSRVTAAACDQETALLAGDVYYARGLRLIAARGDAAAVGLLSRLMAACSYLRSVGAPFAADDALWASTMAGLAALRRGARPGVVERLFDDVDDGLVQGVAMDIAALAKAAAPSLALPDTSPLMAELDALGSGARVLAIGTNDRR
jgi:hypothetical protein